MNNGDLFDDVLPPAQCHSPTSRDAALAILPNAGTWRRRVLDNISAAGAYGMTDDELQRRMHLNPLTQRPRRVELVTAGLVKDSGHKRKTRSGRRAVVWVVTP